MLVSRCLQDVDVELFWKESLESRAVLCENVVSSFPVSSVKCGMMDTNSPRVVEVAEIGGV